LDTSKAGFTDSNFTPDMKVFPLRKMFQRFIWRFPQMCKC